MPNVLELKLKRIWSHLTTVNDPDLSYEINKAHPRGSLGTCVEKIVNLSFDLDIQSIINHVTGVILSS